MPNLEQIGTEAIVEGYDEFMSNLRNMSKQYDVTVGRFRDSSGRFVASSSLMNSAIGSFFSNIKSNVQNIPVVGKALSATESVLSSIGSVATMTGIAFIGVGAAALSAGKSLVSLIVNATGAGEAASFISGMFKEVLDTFRVLSPESMELAGHFQEMEFVSLAIGRSMGMTEDAIRDGTAQLVEAGIRTDVASKTVAQFARNQIDLARSTDLARIAQATAVLTSEDSSATLEHLTWAVTSGNTMMLRRMGIFMDVKSTEEAYAASIGKTEEALTQQERITARVNGIIENSASLMDVYGAAMESPSKALRSLTGRLLPELQAALGAPFLGMWSTVIKSVGGLVKALTSAVKEGGALYPILVNLGAVASLLADGFSAAVGVVTDFVSGIQTTLFDGMGDTAEGMLSYGIEIVASLAEGIVSAASTILVSAMNYIGGILASWLAPGSPPKVAPELDKWGAGTFTEYLRGFSDADFNVLDTVQSTLKKYLSGGEFAALSADLARGLSMGEVDQTFFDSLRAAAGDLGPELEKLVKSELQLASAVEKVKAAEDALAKAQQAEEGAQKQIDALTDEYNELLRTGASKELLKAKLAEINATEKQRSTARAQRREAETALTTAEDQAGTAQDQVDFQKKLLAQLEEMVQDQKSVSDQDSKRAKAAEKLERKLKGAAGAADDLMGALGAPIAADFDITSRMDEAVKAAKEALREKLGDLFAPLGEAWQRSLGGPLARLSQTFDGFRDTVANAMEVLGQRVTAAWDTIRNWAIANWPLVQAAALTAWEVIKSAVGAVADVLLNQTWPQLQDAFAKIGEALSAFGITWGDVWEAVKVGIIAGAAIIGAVILGILGVVTGLVNGVASALNTLAGVWSNAVDALKGIIEGFSTWFAGISEFVQGILTLDFPRALEGFKKAWQGAWDFVRNILRLLLNGVTGTLRTIISFVGGFVRAFIGWFQTLYDELFGESIIPDIIKGFTGFMDFLKKELGPAIDWFVKNVIDPFRNALEGVLSFIIMLIGYVKKLKDALKKVDGAADNLSGHSPSPLERGLRGAGSAMRQLYRVELPKLQSAFQTQPAGAGATNMTTVNNTRNVTYNLAVNTTQNAGAVVSDYHMMRAMAGVS